MMISTFKRRAGFSLFEVLLVMALFSSTLFVVIRFRSNLDLLQNIVNQKLQSRQDIDQAFQRLVTDIRSAGPSSLGGYAIEAAATGSLTFYSDIDKDGIFERVRYFLASSTSATTTLQRGIVEPAGNPLVYATSTEIVATAAANVVNTSTVQLFAYYDANYTGSEAPLSVPITTTAVRLVKISLLAAVNPNTAPVSPLFSDLVRIRNLRSN
ncbi:MAG: hypothetical protein AAB867_02325 [Patescibacteria group bacterium]